MKTQDSRRPNSVSSCGQQLAKVLLACMFFVLVAQSNSVVRGQTAIPSSSDAQRAETNLQTPSAHSQYGHANQWRTKLRMDSDTRVRPLWSMEVGLGRGQVVGDNQTIYQTSGSSKKTGDTTLVETHITAHRLADGKTLWKKTQRFPMSDQQETFGGAMATPRSTPLILGDDIFVTTFTGQLVCLNRKTGESRWEKDLVETFAAVPVQFGFSSSLVASPRKSLVLLAAGQNGGLLDLDPQTGKVNWQSNVETPSYATPVLANLRGVSQWLIVSETAIRGIRDTDGKLLWQFSLPIHGQTNVPTPVVINDGELVISGQGSRGTRCLTVSKDAKGFWEVDEKWYQPRVEFFYTNCSMLDQKTLVGSDGKLLVALDVQTGQMVGRFRGYNDANVLLTQTGLLSLGGKGKLSVLQSTKENGDTINGLTVLQVFQLGSGRCWTPPTAIGKKLLVRIGDRLLCFEVSQSSTADDLPGLLSGAKPLTFETREPAVEGDPTEAIFATYQTEGQAAALKLYSQLRKRGQLKVKHRVALAQAAHEQELIEVRDLILDHANQDFPGSQLIKETTKMLRK